MPQWAYSPDHQGLHSKGNLSPSYLLLNFSIQTKTKGGKSHHRKMQTTASRQAHQELKS